MSYIITIWEWYSELSHVAGPSYFEFRFSLGLGLGLELGLVFWVQLGVGVGVGFGLGPVPDLIQCFYNSFSAQLY